MNRNYLSEYLAAAGESAAKGAKGLGRRVLVHLASLLIAAGGASIADASSPLAGHSAFLGGCIYIGLICLVPKGIGNNSKWLIPSGTGFLQFIFLALSGIPWQIAIFGGGLQTWLQRLFRTRGGMGWEWVVSIFLLGGVLKTFELLAPLQLGIAQFWSFPLVALAGFAFQSIYFRKKTLPAYRNRLRDAQRRLMNALASRLLPDPLQEPLRQLSQETEQFGNLYRTWREEDLRLVETADAISRQAEGLLARTAPGLWDERAGQLFGKMEDFNEQLRKQMRTLPQKPAELDADEGQKRFDLPEDASLEERIEAFRKAALSLEAKRKSLPQELQGHLEGIYNATENILACMLEDPEDRAPGEKFLRRYLPAAHSVVDEHIRLQTGGARYQNVQEALARSAELLARLEQAFVSEHGSLLQNDAMKFTVELNTLDTLLKMQGR